MKTSRLNYLALLILALTVGLCFAPGCASISAPSARVVEAKTLASVGATAKAGIDTAAQLLAKGQITVAQYQKVAAFYDNQWQPAFKLAVAATHSDLSSLASPDLASLAVQFATLVAQLTSK